MLIHLNFYSIFDQNAVTIGARKWHPIEISSYLLLAKRLGKGPIVIWVNSSGREDIYVFNEFIDNFCRRGVTINWTDQP